MTTPPKTPLGRLSDWVLPPRVRRVVEDHAAWRVTTPPGMGAELRRNRALRGIHAGRRCFVLANGPSIGREDLAPLAGELSLSVSNFYKHALYRTIAPRYHLVPDVLPPHDDGTILRWFREMQAEIGGATLLLGSRQLPLVRRERPFPGREVHFLHMRASPEPHQGNLELHRGMAQVASVPIMAIAAALYMGCTRIYLLGTDHSSLFTGEYHYFFERSRAVLKDPYAGADGTRTYDLELELRVHHRLWLQYGALRAVAEARGAEIVNLAQGSHLDVFPRGSLAEVLSSPEGARSGG